MMFDISCVLRTAIFAWISQSVCVCLCAHICVCVFQQWWSWMVMTLGSRPGGNWQRETLFRWLPVRYRWLFIGSNLSDYLQYVCVIFLHFHNTFTLLPQLCWDIKMSASDETPSVGSDSSNTFRNLFGACEFPWRQSQKKVSYCMSQENFIFYLSQHHWRVSAHWSSFCLSELKTEVTVWQWLLMNSVS